MQQFTVMLLHNKIYIQARDLAWITNAFANYAFIYAYFIDYISLNY